MTPNKARRSLRSTRGKKGYDYDSRRGWRGKGKRKRRVKCRTARRHLEKSSLCGEPVPEPDPVDVRPLHPTMVPWRQAPVTQAPPRAAAERYSPPSSKGGQTRAGARRTETNEAVTECQIKGAVAGLVCGAVCGGREGRAQCPLCPSAPRVLMELWQLRFSSLAASTGPRRSRPVHDLKRGINRFGCRGRPRLEQRTLATTLQRAMSPTRVPGPVPRCPFDAANLPPCVVDGGAKGGHEGGRKRGRAADPGLVVYCVGDRSANDAGRREIAADPFLVLIVAVSRGSRSSASRCCC